MNNKYSLGIDTSNYKTSLAVTDDKGNIVVDLRRPLKVKPGQRGLRQSEAFFQHIKALPEMMTDLRLQFDSSFCVAAYSSRPRPVPGSYMPVFIAGKSIAQSIAEALKIPLFAFSHQEGHIAAVKEYSPLKDEASFLVCHFSGGTCELLKCTPQGMSIVGGTEDISFGQVIDRAGVAMGYEFPAGEELDKIALNTNVSSDILTTIKVKSSRLNLSGIDTQIKNILPNIGLTDRPALIREIFQKLCTSMIALISQGVEQCGLQDVIITGGVSSSVFIKNMIEDILKNTGIRVIFGKGNMAQDNAVGIALLGGKHIWE